MEEKDTKEILDFLLNSYRAKLAIQDSGGKCSFDFANSFLSAWKRGNGKWDELRESMLVKVSPLLKEGILDSILPYLTSTLVRQQQSNYWPASISNSSRIHSSRLFSDSEFINDIHLLTPAAGVKGKKPLVMSRGKDSIVGGVDDFEIVIHVCDETKGVKEDFRCLQSILIKEMSYFSRVTIKGQRLKDMDISVHCDIGVFDKLMKWIESKYNLNMPKLKLEPSNVIGLAVSADFLQMTDLTNECLLYIYENIGQVIANSPNLGCLSDSLTCRLATYIDNSEMERRIVKLDKNDRIISKLYIQFILSLNDVDPNMSRGHFASTVTLFSCEFCNKLLINEIAPKIPCNYMRFDARGRIYASHSKAMNWCLSTHIRDLKKELKTWRRVYWILWGTVHFFYCSLCHLYFAAKDLGTCRYHPDQPKFILKLESSTSLSAKDNPKSSGEKKSEETDKSRELPYGKFPCCKEPAYLYSPLPQTNGCQLKDHIVDLYSNEDANLVRMLSFRDLVVQSFPTKSRFEWSSVIQLGCLGASEKITASSNNNSSYSKSSNTTPNPNNNGAILSFENEPKDNISNFSTNTGTGISNADYQNYSNSSDSEPEQDMLLTNSTIGNSGGLINTRNYDTWSWNNELTTRYNQDMQREKEEKFMFGLSAILSQRIPLESTNSIGAAYQHGTGGKFGFRRIIRENLGGSFVKLENCWKEENLSRINRTSSSSKQQ